MRAASLSFNANCSPGRRPRLPPSSALSPAFLGELYGADSEQLFLPGLTPSQAASSQIIAKPGAHIAARHPAGVPDYGLAAGAGG